MRLTATRLAEEVLNTGALRFSQDIDPVPSKNTTLIDKGHHVCNRRNPHEVEPPLLPPIFEGNAPILFSPHENCLYEFKCDRRPAYPLKRVRIVALWIDDCVRIRKCWGGLVVVGHNNVNSYRVRDIDCCVVGNPTVDGDNELCISQGKLRYRLCVEPIPLIMAVRNVVFKIGVCNCSKKVVEEYSAGDTVAVVVSIDDDVFLMLNRTQHTFHSLLHVGEEKGVVEVFVIARVEEFLRRYRISDPTMKEKLLDEWLVCTKCITNVIRNSNRRMCFRIRHGGMILPHSSVVDFQQKSTPFQRYF